MRPRRRGLRALALLVALVGATSACKMDIKLTTTVERDGSGVFSLQFVIDKELAELARQVGGEDPFAELREFPEGLKKTGWTFHQSTEGGGLTLTLERPFADAADLNRALEQLEREADLQEGPTAKFFKVRLDRSSGFLRTRTRIEGSIDLSPEGLLGSADLPGETAQDLQGVIQQAADQFFDFTVTARLPGRVSSSGGDPGEVDGGTVVWSPRLGKTLEFTAEAQAYNPAALAVIAGPIVLLLGLLLWTALRRRRGRQPVLEGFGAPPEAWEPAPPEPEAARPEAAPPESAPPEAARPEE